MTNCPRHEFALRAMCPGFVISKYYFFAWKGFEHDRAVSRGHACTIRVHRGNGAHASTKSIFRITTLARPHFYSNPTAITEATMETVGEIVDFGPHI